MPAHLSMASCRQGFGRHLPVVAEQPAFEPIDDRHWIVSVLHVAANQVIYAEGDDADAFYCIASGVVRACRFSGDGQRQIEAFYGNGDLFGCEPAARRCFTVEAVCDCTIMCYRRRGPAVCPPGGMPGHRVVPVIMRDRARTRERTMLLDHRDAAERVAAFLLDWNRRCGRGDAITLAMTRNDIADYLGLTFETVSRSFAQLEREGLIEFASARRIRILDRDGLEDLTR